MDFIFNTSRLHKKSILCSIILLFLFFYPLLSSAQTEKIVNLVVAYKTVNFTGKFARAISINNQVPGPTLHFKQGDCVTINVYNHLDEGTAIHWHGVLVPWQMDGVEHVTQRAIPAGGCFQYKFKLLQAGTYWYHAHAGLQEQEGLYGAFIIDPLVQQKYEYHKDYVVILSDWNNAPADRVFANLKKDGEYYASEFPLAPSLIKFLYDYNKATFCERKELLKDYKSMQTMRMGLYDLSDVSYDAYLLNGHGRCQPWRGQVCVGDIVRLRIINAGSSTIYRLKIPGNIMQVVQVDGNDVRPFCQNDFFIAPAETYDVLVKIKDTCPAVIYAESIDTLGKAYGALVVNPYQPLDLLAIEPFPEPKPVTREMRANMMAGMSDMHKNHAMHHLSTKSVMQHQEDNKPMPTEPTIVGDAICCPTNKQLAELTTGTKYQNLIAAVPTNNPRRTVDAVIKMELYGYMGRFIWFINGLPEYRAKPIVIEPNKRYRIIFTNISMMRHPMHLHGHWFILRNGHGAYDPLLHTIDVPPGAKVVADVDTDASGQWFFHCHNLYHMAAGMARVLQYATMKAVACQVLPPEDYLEEGTYPNRPIVRVDEQIPLDDALIIHPLGHRQGLYKASWLDVGEDPFHNFQQLTFKGLYGGDYHKLELFINDAEMDHGQIQNADIDIFSWHLISQFWAVKAGANYYYRPAKVPYWQPGIGLEGLTPYFIDTDLRAYYYAGAGKLDVHLSRDTQLTRNFFVRTGIRGLVASRTVPRAEIGSGLNWLQLTVRPYYRILTGVNLYTQYEHDQDYGAFKRFEHEEGDPTRLDTLTFGISLLF